MARKTDPHSQVGIARIIGYGCSGMTQQEIALKEGVTENTLAQLFTIFKEAAGATPLHFSERGEEIRRQREIAQGKPPSGSPRALLAEYDRLVAAASLAGVDLQKRTMRIETVVKIEG